MSDVCLLRLWMLQVTEKISLEGNGGTKRKVLSDLKWNKGELYKWKSHFVYSLIFRFRPVTTLAKVLPRHQVVYFKMICVSTGSASNDFGDFAQFQSANASSPTGSVGKLPFTVFVNNLFDDFLAKYFEEEWVAVCWYGAFVLYGTQNNMIC